MVKTTKKSLLPQWLHNYWRETVAGLLIAGAVYFGVNLFREVGEVSTSIDGFNTKFDGLSTQIEAVDSKFVGVGERFEVVADRIEDSQKASDRLVTTVEKLADRFEGLKEVPTRLAVVEEKVNSIQRDVESLRSQRSVVTQAITQGGRFGADPDAPPQEVNFPVGFPPQYEWQLQVPVDPTKVVSISAETVPPISGVAVTVKLSDDGRSCIMTLHGDPQMLEDLPKPISAQVTINVRS
jgi:hypothetical protein